MLIDVHGAKLATSRTE